MAGEADETAKAGAIFNIILFPNPSVIIPFPMALVGGDSVAASIEGTFGVASGAEQSPASAAEESASFSNHSDTSTGNIVSLPTSSSKNPSGSSDQPDRGMDVTKLSLRPVTNLERVGMTAAPETPTVAQAEFESAGSLNSIVSIAFPKPSPPGGLTNSSDSAPSIDGLTQLPGALKSAEDSAREAGFHPLGEIKSGQGDTAPKLPASAALPRVEASFADNAEPTGIPAAKLHSDMNFSSDTHQEQAFEERFEGRLAEFTDSATPSPEGIETINLSDRIVGASQWQAGRTIGNTDRLAPELSRTDSIAQADTVDRISRLVVREAALVRQYHSDSMAVVLRPDAETELYVHLSQRNGQIEAVIRCERGDSHQLGALWSQLQESLAAQKVRLAPLQESPGSQNFNPSSTSSGFGGQGHGSSRQSPDKQSLDEWPAPASSQPAPLRDERGSGRRRVTTSRPGWESWA